MKKARLCFHLFLSFLKIGAFTFGGGYAMIPVIQHEAAEKKKWVTEADILDIVAISESTPGPISVNAATFIGMRVAGVAGAACATFGLVLPSFLIILILSSALELISGYTAVKYAFFGIRAAVLGLILSGAVKMYKSCPKNLFSYIIGAAAFAVSLFTSLNVILIVAAGGLLGLATFLTAKNTSANAAAKAAKNTVATPENHGKKTAGTPDREHPDAPEKDVKADESGDGSSDGGENAASDGEEDGR